MKECPNNRHPGRNPGNRAQSSLVATPDRDAPKGVTFSTGGWTNRLYVITSHQEQEKSPDVVTAMIKVFIFYIYVETQEKICLCNSLYCK